MLHTVVNGAPTGRPPLLIAHGLFGSARNWNAISRRLSEVRQVLTVDMRNHGESDWAAPHDYPAMAADLAEVISAHGGRADVLGHSMGGKAAMTLALTTPDLVARLIVADVAPVPYTHSQIEPLRAMQHLDLNGLTSRMEADRRMALAVDDPAMRAFLLQSLDLRADPPRWRLNLSQIETDMDAILSFPEFTSRFDGPTLFLRGALSNYIRPEVEPIIRRLFPHAEFQTIDGAGHWLHADKPREFEAAVAAFLEEAE